MSSSEPLSSDLSRDKSRTVADRITADLLKKIVTGEWPAGDKLPAERKLAEDLGVSRVSLRAALQRLKAQGFLESVQGGGNRVISKIGTKDPALLALVQMDEGSLSDLMEMRTMLEIWAAKKAAKNITEHQRAILLSIVADMQTENGDIVELDVSLHMTIAEATGSVAYLHVLDIIRSTLGELIRYNRHQLFADAGVADNTTVQHQAIVDAIVAGDQQAAAAAMEEHLNWVMTCYRKVGLVLG